MEFSLSHSIKKYEPIKVGKNDRLDIFGKVLGKCDFSEIAKHSK